MLLRPRGGLEAPLSTGHSSVQHRPGASPRGRRAATLCAGSEDSRLQVVFVTTEVAPWSKVGGLADVLAALPVALAARGHSVMTVAPRYAEYGGVVKTGVVVPLELPVGTAAPVGEGSMPQEVPQQHGRRRRRGKRRLQHAAAAVPADLAAHSPGQVEQQQALGDAQRDAEGSSSSGSSSDDAAAVPKHAALFHARQGGVDRIFVDHPLLRTENIYGGHGGSGGGGGATLTYIEHGQCSDLDLRYSILCQAALAAPVLLRPMVPGTPVRGGRVIYVANDWPTALLILRLRYALQCDLPISAAGSGVVAGAAGESGRFSEAPADVEELHELLARHLATAATAYCIHNLAYQGVHPASAFPRLCLPSTALPALCTTRDWRAVVEGRQVAALPSSGGPAGGEEAACQGGELNFMRAAILACDEAVTVSADYAEEVQTDAAAGCGLQEIIAAKGITGIMNGIDVVEWDPELDPLLPPEGQYCSCTMLQGKAHMKQLLQRRLGLREDPSAPLFVFVGRLTQQKGVDVLLGAAPLLLQPSSVPMPVPMPRITAADEPLQQQQQQQQPDAAVGNVIAVTASCCVSNAARAIRLQVGAPAERPVPAAAAGPGSGAPGSLQLVVLGTGEAWMEDALKGLSQSFPGQAAGLPDFSEELAHWLLAAADYCLVPSRFEPCGLVAQCGARYGAVPIVTAVGGLKDLVTPDVGLTCPPLSSEGDPSGHRRDVQALAATVRLAAVECGGGRHRRMQARCMELDLSWERPAAKWEALLLRLARRRGP